MTEQTERLTLSVEEAAAAVGISERHLRSLIAEGDFPAVRFGKRVLIVKTQLEAWLQKQAVAV